MLTSSSFGQGSLEVIVRNIRLTKGTIRVGLFPNEDSFLKNAVTGKVTKATTGEVRVVFEGLKAGEYGLSVIHDENDNGEIDNNVIGIPTEGFAFGNNSMGMFGPPPFEKAKLRVTDHQETSQVLILKYL